MFLYTFSYHSFEVIKIEIILKREKAKKKNEVSIYISEILCVYLEYIFVK